MALDIAKYQVDFAGGDANGSLYKFYKSDEENIGQLSIKQSSLMMTIQTMVDAVNTVCSPLHGGKMPLAYQAVTATTWANLEAINDWFQRSPEERKSMTYPDQDVICMLAFSWGHTKWADSSRQQCQAYLEQAGRDVAVGEYLISVNELAMSLQNHNLWLNPTDADHHRPLQVVLRAFTQKNYKFEGQMSAKQRQNRDKSAPRKRSTATTGYKRSEEWEEAYSQVPPWKTREGEVWQN
jgi:hypothetical protein